MRRGRSRGVLPYRGVGEVCLQSALAGKIDCHCLRGVDFPLIKRPRPPLTEIEMTRSYSLSCFACFALAGLAACSAPAEDDGVAEGSFSSREATLVDFEFDGELVTDSTWNVEQKIEDQFLYTIGHLNAQRSVGRLDKVEVTNVQKTTLARGEIKVTYHARLPVSWGSKTSVPSKYSFTLPKLVSFSGLESFTSKYKDRCVDHSAHDVDSGSMWYYYRPSTSGCTLDSSDVVTFEATVTKSTENTTGKYPEYHKVWEDDALRVVAIFGKNEDGATQSDAGIDAYNAFVASMRTALGNLSLTTVPADAGSAPGVSKPEVTFNAKLDATKTISVTALLVDNVRTAGAAFDARYEELSPNADVIMYNGHAGLGQNVQALARKGRFLADKYLLLFMNGCDTFAYVDGYLAETRAALNPSDPEGTKFMDIVTNGMPSYFHSNARASTALVKGLMSIAQPKTFEQMFSDIDTEQVVLVTGEEDNAFTPGMPIGGGGGGGGGGGEGYKLDESGSVGKGQNKSWSTPELDAGKYIVRIAHDSNAPGGDADLYVRAGTKPTLTKFDCRPYENGSDEVCEIALQSKKKLNVMVNGYASGQSAFVLSIRKQ